ncbi:hypothetical protein [Pseudomonas sp. EpS/L25]|uniref:hypothetical protein n=1 Tax=Pseudomonas sp. EpS/L25 TaxID=1749078 RepID=UPI00128F5ED5|nr:hypothetical protein [Pseudomonas sp. EpS/L25]
MLEVHGVDLYREWVALILEGGESAIRGFSELPKYSGFVLFPEPVGKQFGGIRNAFESVAVYDASFAENGHVFDGAGGYEKLPARFKFSSFSEDELRGEIARCMQEFTYEVNDLIRR